MPVSEAIRHRALADLRRDDWAGIQRCEAAFVLLLSRPLHDGILRVRRTCEALGDPGAQPAPHVTVLFLGDRTPAQMWRAAAVIEPVHDRHLEVTLGSLGFFGAGSLVTNLHCKVERATELIALHHTCLASLAVLAETSDSRYAREKYAPHVSIFDGISAARGVVEGLLPRVSLPLRGSATEMAIMWKPLELDP